MQLKISVKEYMLIRRLARGDSVSKIRKDLNISHNTIYMMFSVIANKLGVFSHKQLTLFLKLEADNIKPMDLAEFSEAYLKDNKNMAFEHNSLLQGRLNKATQQLKELRDENNYLRKRNKMIVNQYEKLKAKKDLKVKKVRQRESKLQIITKVVDISLPTGIMNTSLTSKGVIND